MSKLAEFLRTEIPPTAKPANPAKDHPEIIGAVLAQHRDAVVTVMLYRLQMKRAA